MPRLKLGTGFCAAALASLTLASPAAAQDFAINNLGDSVIPAPDGICDALPAAGNQCTLREAVSEANANPAPSELTFGIPGTIVLNQGAIAVTAGDLEIVGQGDGNSMFDTIISGNNASPLLEVDDGLNDIRISDVYLTAAIGGSIITDSTAFFINVTVTSNTATGASARGGGILGDDPAATLHIEDSVITGNDATGTNTSYGGGIYSEGPLVIENSVISGNDATGGSVQNQGGGVFAEDNFDLDGVTFSGNTVGGTDPSGAGLVGDGGAAANELIENSTFSGNTGAMSGGGGAVIQDTTTITNTTFTGNTAGVGADLQVTGAGITTTKNAIFGSTGACDEDGGATIVPATPVGNNIDVGTSCDFASVGGSSGNQNSTNPMLGPLTQGTPSEPPSHRPMPLSPAVDMALTDCGPMTDQRGVAKPQGPACDIGSHELDYRDLTVNVNGSGTVTTFLGFPAAINCPPTCAAEFRHGVNVTLLNSPAAGFTFAGYSGDCIGGLCMMVSNRIANAFFAPITPPSGGGGASIPQSTPPAKPPFDLQAALKKCKKKKGKARSRCIRRAREQARQNP
jgi:hypothetical protein